MSWTLCTSGAAIAKAGVNANVSGSLLAEWSTEVEGSICAYSRKDWVAGYSAVGTNFRGILNDVCSDLIAMKIIAFDMGGFTSRLEAQTMLDVLRDNALRGLDVLKDDKHKEVMD